MNHDRATRYMLAYLRNRPTSAAGWRRLRNVGIGFRAVPPLLACAYFVVVLIGMTKGEPVLAGVDACICVAFLVIAGAGLSYALACDKRLNQAGRQDFVAQTARFVMAAVRERVPVPPPSDLRVNDMRVLESALAMVRADWEKSAHSAGGDA